MTTVPLIHAKNLTRIFDATPGRPPIRAVNGLSVSIPASARLVALVGPDGAGKSTLMRLVCGLEVPDDGWVEVLGQTPDPDDEGFLETVAYMPQSLGLYKDLSVIENLELFGTLRGAKPMHEGMTLEAHYQHLLTLTGLAGFENRLAGQLSGGMKQKLALSIALVRAPRLLMLDEPTVGVDPLSRRELWGIIDHMMASTQTTCLFSTAYLEEAEKADWVICLTDGHLLAADTPQALLAKAQGQTFWVHLGEKPDAIKQTYTRRLMQSVVGAVEHSLCLDVVPRDGAVELLTQTPQTIETVKAWLGQLWDDAFLECVEVTPRPARMEDTYALMTFEGTHRAEPGITVDALATQKAQNTPTTSPVEATQDAPYVIEATDVSRHFGDFVAVAQSSFTVRRGEIFGLLGPNGAGKTTTFRMLCGLLTPSSGHVTLEGRDLRKALAKARADIGYVAQKFSLYANLTVEANLRYFARSYGFYGAALTQKVDDALVAYELADYRAMTANDLPLGAKRDLAIACALLHHPNILFLDEATSGADLASRRHFWRGLTRLAAQGTTIVVTTHFMEEAEYCDRFLIQEAGRILAIGTPDDIRGVARKVSNGKPIRSIEEAFIAVVEDDRRARNQSPSPVGAFHD